MRIYFPPVFFIGAVAAGARGRKGESSVSQSVSQSVVQVLSPCLPQNEPERERERAFHDRSKSTQAK